MKHDEWHFDPQQVAKLEAPERGTQFPIDTILDAIDISGALDVADIGAGSGYYTLPIARRVTGQVWAVEPTAELRTVIAGKLTQPDAPRNVAVVAGEASATGLAAASCDLIFLSAVWHEIDDLTLALQELRRIAKPKATVAVLDWRADAAVQPPGPPQAHRVPRSVTQAQLEQSGWNVAHCDDVNAWVYLVLGRR